MVIEYTSVLMSEENSAGLFQRALEAPVAAQDEPNIESDRDVSILFGVRAITLPSFRTNSSETHDRHLNSRGTLL